MNSIVTEEQEKLQHAFELHQSGQLAQAQAVYEEVLTAQPRNSVVINLLGAIALQTRNPQRAIELFGKAVELDPNNVVAHCNSGLALRELRQFDAALAKYEQAIAINAAVAEVHFNRGNVLRELNRPEAALSSYEQAIAIDADHAEAYLCRGKVLHELRQWDAALSNYNQAIAIVADYEEAYFCRGNMLYENRRWEAALASYNRAIELKPDYAEACCNRGHALFALKQWNAALASYNRAIELKPDYAEACCNRGHVLFELEQSEAALASYNQAIALRPNCAEAYCNRGDVLCELEQWEAALASYNQAIALNFNYAEAYCNRGVVLCELEQWNAALASYNQAIALKPDYAESYCNRGLVLTKLKQWNAALASCDQAIALRPDYASAYFNRSTVYLLRGDFDRGWIDYEWRRRSRQFIKDERTLTQPLWLGEESIAGTTILLHSEQGLGDTLQFCRYVKSVADLSANVVLEVRKPLLSLLAGLEGVSHLIARGDALPDFDCRCPLPSLPLAFKTTLDTIPSSVRYLTSDACKVEQWQARLGEKTKARIGLVWSGNTMHENDHNRSISLADLISHLPLAYQYVSLQKDVREPDRQTLQSNPQILQFSDDLNDFSDTAALCDCMDLVISVDTSVAHLSAALGKSTWILLPFIPDWRWLLDRDDSPWYPTARLYRQHRAGDWNEVLEQVNADLIQTLDPK